MRNVLEAHAAPGSGRTRRWRNAQATAWVAHLVGCAALAAVMMPSTPASAAGQLMSTPSNAVPAYGPPGPPGNVNAVATGNLGEVYVTWTPPADDNGSPLTGYTISIVSGPACGACTGLTAGPTDTYTIVRGLGGLTYQFAIQAVNAAGGGVQALTPQVTPYSCGLCAAPKPPTDVQAVGTGVTGEVTVTWVPNNTSDVLPVTGYLAYPASCQLVGVCVGADVSDSDTSATINGLHDAATYTFVVMAVDADGAGPPSIASAPVVPFGPPLAPDAPVAGIGSAPQLVTLHWKGARDNGSPLTGFTVTPDPPCPSCTGLATTRWATVIRGLTPGTSYTFSVTASNAAGPGAPSGPSNAVTPLAPPSRPPAPWVTRAGTTVTVHWRVPADGGSPITSFTLTVTPRRVPVGARSQDVQTIIIPATGGHVSPLPGAVDSYVVANGLDDRYAVAATNAVGTGPPSAYGTWLGG